MNMKLTATARHSWTPAAVVVLAGFTAFVATVSWFTTAYPANRWWEPASLYVGLGGCAATGIVWPLVRPSADCEPWLFGEWLWVANGMVWTVNLTLTVAQVSEGLAVAMWGATHLFTVASVLLGVGWLARNRRITSGADSASFVHACGLVLPLFQGGLAVAAIVLGPGP